MQRTITITGPDGAGKSSVADNLVDVLGADAEVRRFHHRLRGLPSSDESRRATTTPQDNIPYGRVTSTLKLLYLFADEIVGWWTKARPVLRRGGWVVVERGWWDLLVDPRRYRLRDAPRLVGLLGRALPGVRTTVILSAPAALMRERKPELPISEIARQLEVWRELGETLDDAVVVSVDRPLAEVCAEVAEVVVGAPPGASRSKTGSPQRWVSLGGSSRRLALSTTTRWGALRGLDLYQPMRVGDLLAWHAARGAAAAGLLRLLPQAPEPRLRWALEAHVPAGGTFSLLGGSSADRGVAMLLDRDGRTRGIVKVALDAEGRAKLAREAEATRTYGPLLEAPLLAPRVLEARDGVVVFEVVACRPRWRSWLLDEELAHGLGRLHQQVVDGRSAIAHGDFAPWNVMRSRAGWHLIDWEEAGPDRPPFEDVFHYVVQGHALLGRPTASEVLAGVRLEGRVGQALRAYAAGADADLADVPDRFVAYLRSSQRALLPRDDRVAGVSARADLLGRLGDPSPAGRAPADP